MAVNAREQLQRYRAEMGQEAAERQQRAAAKRCSCGRLIRFVFVSGRWMPIDYDAHEGGNILVWPDGRTQMTESGGPPAGLPDGAELHYSHFATCPQADRFRRDAPRRRGNR